MNARFETRHYMLRSLSLGSGWAEIVITLGGFLAAVSDYGDYVYAWRSFGPQDFRQFLLEAEKDVDYFVKKLQPGGERAGYYDGPATERGIRDEILSLRRQRRLSIVEARDEWELLRAHEVYVSPVEFSAWCRETELCDPWEYSRTNRDPQTRMFVEKLLVGRLCPMLREELAREGVG